MLNGDRLQNAIVAKEMNGKIFVSCIQSIGLFGVPQGEKQSHEEKLKASLSRSKSKVLELAYCNTWDMFVTITFSKEKVKNRYNIQETLTNLRTWLNNHKKRHCNELKYLLIPELHKDGAVHVHGLIAGINQDEFKKFSDYSPDEIIKNDWQKLAEDGYYNWLPLEKKFGRNSCGPIKSNEAVSYYVTKYISKDMVSAVTEKNLNTYYASKGLKRAERIGIYDSAKTSVATLKWDWQSTFVDKETGELIETSTYKKTFENRSQFQLWLKMNGITEIKTE